MTVHTLFIIMTFAIAIFAPFYVGLSFILLHWLHEKYVGDCLLTVLQRKYGYIEENEDFYHYFFKKIKLPLNSKVTMNIHYGVKTVVLLIIIFNFYHFLT